MGQRGVRVSGTPLSEVQYVLADRFRETLRRSGADVISSDTAPDLNSLGFELVGEMELDLLGRSVRTEQYSGKDQAVPLDVVRLESPGTLIRFDPLGRQLPLLPGVRIEDTVDIGLPGVLVGMVVLGLEDEALIVLTIGLEEAREVADLLVPPPEEPPPFDSLVQGAILEGTPRPMNIG